MGGTAIVGGMLLPTIQSEPGLEEEQIRTLDRSARVPLSISRETPLGPDFRPAPRGDEGRGLGERQPAGRVIWCPQWTDVQHCDGVVARVLLLCRHSDSEPIGPFAGIGDLS